MPFSTFNAILGAAGVGNTSDSDWTAYDGSNDHPSLVSNIYGSSSQDSFVVLDENRIAMGYRSASTTTNVALLKRINNVWRNVDEDQISTSHNYFSLEKVDTDKIIFGYRDATGTQQAKIVTFDDEAVNTIGTAVSINPDGSPPAFGMVPFASMDSTHILFAYSRTGSNELDARVLTISGTTITAGTILTINSDSVTDGSVCVQKYDTDKYIVCWRDSSNNAKVQFLTTSGTTVSTSGSVTTAGNAADAFEFALAKLTTDLAFWAYTDTGDDLIGYPVDLTGASPSLGTAVTIESGSSGNEPQETYCIRSTNSQALLTFRDKADSDKGQLCVIDVTSSSATVVSTTTITPSTGGSNYLSGVIRKLSAGEMFVSFNGTNDGYMKQINLEASGSGMENIEIWFDFATHNTFYGSQASITSLVAEPPSDNSLDTEDYLTDRGAAAGAGSDDPTFNGTDNGLSSAEYMSFDGGDFFEKQAGNTTFVNSMHKNNASFTIMAVLRPAASPSNERIFCTEAGGTGDGILFHTDASGNLRLSVGNTTATDVLDVTSSTVQLDGSEIQIAGVSLDEASGSGASTFFRQDTDGLESETFDGTYTSPSTGSSSNYRIGADTGGNAYFTNGTRLYTILVFNTALSLQQMTDIANGLNPRYW